MTSVGQTLPKSDLHQGAIEAALGFAIVLPLLFVNQITSAGPAASFAATAVYAWVHRARLGEIFFRRWPLLLIPALAIVSTIWSSYPDLTAKHSLELTMTVAGGLLLSASPRPASMLAGAFAAFAVFLAASLVLGHSVGVGDVGDVASSGDEQAFAGLNGGKNLLGMTAAMAALLSLFVLSYSARRLSLVGVAVAAAALAMEGYLLWAARSAGATVATLLAVIAFAIVAMLRAFPPRARAWVSAALIAALVALGAWGYTFAGSVTAAALGIFHKDPTLTGRSYLWYRSADIIRERALLGHGFEAFWVRGNIDAEGFWQYAKVTQRSGFSFHNTLIEMLIDFGWLGAALLLAVFAVAFFALLRRAVRAPSLVSAFFVALLVFNLARAPFESLSPNSVDFSFLFIVAALGFGFGRAQARQPLPAPSFGPTSVLADPA